MAMGVTSLIILSASGRQWLCQCHGQPYVHIDRKFSVKIKPTAGVTDGSRSSYTHIYTCGLPLREGSKVACHDALRKYQCTGDRCDRE